MFHGWWIVSTHFVAQLFIVGFFTYGYPLLVVPVEAEFGSGMEKIAYAMIGSSVIGMTLPPLVGPLVDRWSARSLMQIGAGCMTLGLLGLSVSRDVAQFVVVMALLIGSANVLLGPIAGSAVVSRWFTASRGRALGVAAIGTSVGGMLMPQLFAWGIDEIGWRATLQWLAGMTVVIVWPLLLFAFRDYPADLGMEPEGGDAAAHAIAGAGPAQVDSNRDILRMPAFWIMSTCLAIFLACFMASLTNLPKFAADLGIDGGARATMISVLAFAGMLGKLVFGYLADRMPLKIGLWIAIGLTTLAIAIFSLEPGYWVLLGSAILMGLATGGILPVWGALVGAIFGVANFGRTMGLQGPVISLAAMPAFWIAGRIYDSTGSFAPAFQLFAGLLCVAIIILFALRVPTAAAATAEASEPAALRPSQIPSEPAAEAPIGT